MEVNHARPVGRLQVPVPLQHGGGFPHPQLHQQELLAYCSDDDSEDDNDDEKKPKNAQKNSQNMKTHKKTKKSHKNQGSMLRTAATKKMYKIPINPPKKINKKYKNPKKYDHDEKVNSDDEHATKNMKTSKKSFSYTNVNMFAANADGLQGKLVSLKHEIKEAEAMIFCIQETKYRTKGRIKIDNFVTFEAIRKNKEKGGTVIGIHESLKPVLIEEYSENFELIVVEVNIGGKEIRVMTGYGPQENWTVSEKMPFFVALEKEVSRANINGKSVIIELDANSKLGNSYM